MRKSKRKKLTKAEILNRAISTWENKQEGAVLMLRKSAEMLVKLRRQRKRMLKTVTLHRDGAPLCAGDIPAGVTVTFEVASGKVTQVEEPPPDAKEEDIPEWLDRTKDKDAAAREEIEAQQAEKKKRAAERSAVKRQIKKETTHAELTGQRRRMPLTGKAALAAIHSSK